MPRLDGAAHRRRQRREARRVQRRKIINQMHAILRDPKRASQWAQVRDDLEGEQDR